MTTDRTTQWIVEQKEVVNKYNLKFKKLDVLFASDFRDC
jgi:hypothetical protein